jgi:hypothetical protein
VIVKLVECHFSLTNFRSRDVIDVVLFRIGVIGFPLECAVRLAISRTDTPVRIHGAMNKGQFTRKNVKSEKACSIADLTHFRSRDVYQTYAIRLPDGRLRLDSHLCLAVTGRLHLFHIPELVGIDRLTREIRQVHNFAPLTAFAKLADCTSCWPTSGHVTSSM